MFRKPFKLKFQIQLKNSEKNKFCADLKGLFPALRDEDIESLVGNKKNVIKTKLITFKEKEVEIYCVDKVPMYFKIIDTDIKLPTIFMLWRFPHMLPSFTTNGTVLNKLKNGADLFLPGIYTEGLFFSDLEYKNKDPVYVNLVENKAAMAVGVVLVDKDDVMDGNKHKEIRKIMKVYHTAGDFLFKMNTDAVILQLGPPDWALPVNEDIQVEVKSHAVPTSEQASDEAVNRLTETLNAAELVTSKETPETNPKLESTDLEKDKNDQLLEYCFLKAVKTIPKNSYPILPATFYAKHVLTNLPEGESLNLRKTKWKKFSSFLQEKSLEGIIQLQQMPKSEFTIASANPSHIRVKEFVDPYNVVSVVVEPKADNKMVVQEEFSVNVRTLPLFAKFGFKKHDELTRSDVRNHLNDYIKSEGLVHAENPELVVLDPILYEILKGEEVISRGNLLAGILSKMSVQHKVSNSGNADPTTHKGKMRSVEFETRMRTGNKKVTLINNLEFFGVDVGSFSKELQHKAAASTTITANVPGKKGPQIQVQGNQIAVAVSILKDKYNIHEKFMKGLEKAEKSKNKK